MPPPRLSASNPCRFPEEVLPVISVRMNQTTISLPLMCPPGSKFCQLFAPPKRRETDSALNLL
ncbi:hypothetical protein F3Y22_tig00116997pilonHSYRG00111 [Hibiscus syriacus]|uniref:Uncharacterized protein n=1 Tax=Hibiscus syriacus TaxID=106335 RepID=A0A6A2WE28_HIBSY|nr:hypothetical protein F3Y22_tig00116997pilonHSYRG00111 [Hibiscus syriacus]